MGEKNVHQMKNVILVIVQLVSTKTKCQINKFVVTVQTQTKTTNDTEKFDPKKKKAENHTKY